ncbi:hypothetical protein A3H10_04530 [Candidatus Uhrbacteria bacterium RIFCSPLOWO2_12_FULL_46_10]|uniref:Phosphoribosyltransferase domain-containing protein n=1 Tax=Candidatus Uhrbacteria bacterium RIFCSPLOWO2_01_FULL_47_25 TaxID=1802402 RepID=A0A1F7UW23_9BACT|nr:MAG: hypothetical protein UX68_C0006G0011 [Parcubacteria group bacterium GW2011_GWA2_46_9]OGL59363.1 MAG: hypothetical protein A2752_05395 [Candidatus Uhrbacteria bacterium RIFCSPHIGHO2_01_FULL_46_23]OGL68998.1 MAG: hypothetical protein A3D60_04450 [Candidatus Uhrbacteria bacterium RIFCSPHIGHO2_02_FULL_47_29]OGL76703.1 MAG: hypothetical protein A3E96_00820 [Candidatus Uhrbacteria bacterium RIFCSPHIGHO2_12_FULL_46_13]OGL82491.1 MAG: hypothetical protein A2936_02430 [Candidatus Uhrbacteria bac
MKTVKVPKELVVNLFDRGAIVVGQMITRHDKTETKFDLQLDDLVPTNREIRQQLARLLLRQLRWYYDGNLRTSRFGLVDVSPPINKVVTTISNGVKGECPTASIATRMHNGAPHIKIYGRVAVGFNYTLVDDILWSGHTIADMFGFWFWRHRYPIDYILIFCDAQVGGLASLQKAVNKLTGDVGIKDIPIDCLTTRKEILDILLEANKITREAYDLAMEGAAV